ncbi:MAG: hypothetical protein R3F33_14985 [Planctomycetota bacterium]
MKNDLNSDWMARLRAATLGCALCFGLLTVVPGQDLDPGLRDKDPAARESAVERLTTAGGDKAPAWLLKAAQDKDWGVALAGLRGLQQHGTSKEVKDLMDLAVEAPLLQMRMVAAGALAKADGDEAAQQLYKKLNNKKTRIAVLGALEALAAFGVHPEDTEAIQKLLQNKDVELHVPAPPAWLACARPGSKQAVLETLLSNERLLVRTGALEVLAADPDVACIDGLLTFLSSDGAVSAVEARRAIPALAACLGAAEAGEARDSLLKRLRAACRDGSLRGAAYPLCVQQAGNTGVLTAEQVLAELEAVLGDLKTPGRGAAYRILAQIGSTAADEILRKAVSRERAPGALQALAESLAARRLVTGDEVPEALGRILASGEGKGPDHEALCVALSEPELKGVDEALVGAATSSDGALVLTGIVAVGKARVEGAFGFLRTASENREWRVRGAAATALMHLATAEAFERLMEMLKDEDPSVALTAERGLQRMAGREGQGPPPKGWGAWWAEHRDAAQLRQRERALRDHEKYGYQVPDALIYSGLDVVVVPGRGDHIESVLQRLGIQFRTIEAGKLAAEGLHPTAILIVGCTGELSQSDLEIVRWYVRCGGALFTSCWSLTYTAAAAFPGVLGQYQTRDQVLDQVATHAAAPHSVLLDGVFTTGCQPIYHLEGAHLIRVLDDMRAEVLIDSPEAAERHGSGTMAAWFRIGHGTVLDSVNHYELQGLAMATHIKKATELQAFAVNHLGLALARLRETARESWWNDRSDAAKEVDDLSAFRLLTNFVREKRMRGD